MAEFTVSRATVRKRLILVFILTVLAVLVLISRLAWIQIVKAEELYEKAWDQWNHNVLVQTARGNIYDRGGHLLAGSVSVETVAAIPQQVEDHEEAAAALAPVLNMEVTRIEELMDMDRSAVYIKRKVEPETAEAVREMNIPGIVFFNEEKRDYPGQNLASQLLGFVGMDQGLAGLETYYEDYLSSSQAQLLFPADGHGRQLPHNFKRHAEPGNNYDLHLSIDESIQHIIEKELAVIMEKAAPEQAMALAVDPDTGAVLGAASLPDYDPEAYDQYNPERWTLAPFTSAFEPGSTFKMVTLAAAVEEGVFEPEETYHCSGHVTVSGHQMNCWTYERGGHGEISFYEAVVGSCNPAFIELGNKLGKENLIHYIEGFGFGETTGIDYPGESSGLIFNNEQMGSTELASTAFGQGIAVTPIQQVMAVSAMINGGNLYKPYLVEEIRDRDGETYFKREPEIRRQVVSGETSEKLVDMMESVILDGTGSNADIEGYRVAGKTGTAEKIDEIGNYTEDEFVYSLAGFAPVEDPEMVLYVAVDGVTKGPRYGSQTSAPTFKRIMEDTLHYLQINPSEKDQIEENEEND
ncbi:MAG: penicillin-binding transpeptidase domain-containing protein [Bacillota bacterium]